MVSSGGILRLEFKPGWGRFIEVLPLAPLATARAQGRQDHVCRQHPRSPWSGSGKIVTVLDCGIDDLLEVAED